MYLGYALRKMARELGLCVFRHTYHIITSQFIFLVYPNCPGSGHKVTYDTGSKEKGYQKKLC